jgi:NitT/TauT family transport system substrate-binding protein
MISANRFTPKNGKNSRNCFANYDYPIQASIKTSGDNMIRLAVLLVLSGQFLFAAPPATSSLFAADAPRTKIRIATAAPSLSYFPIYAAVQKGFFARRGFDVELIQMAPSLTAAALLNRSVDYTIIPSTIATAAARGAPAKVIHFASVKLQHSLVVRPEVNTVTDLTGKKIAGSGFGNLVAYEIQFLIDRYKLGPKTTIINAPSSIDRLIAVQKGLAEAAIIAAPADIKGEEMGLKRLIQMGTLLQIPQAGLAATDEKIKTSRGEVIEVLKAAIDGLEYTANQREDATALIGKWMALTPGQALKAYESVKDTYSRDGVPTPEQSKAYIAMLAATAGLNADLPAATIFDFSLSAAAAKELATKR